TSVNTGYFVSGFVSVLGTLLFLGMSSLRFCQTLLILGEKLGVANGFTSGKNHHRAEAKIKTNLSVDGRQGFDLFFNQDGDKVAVCTILGDSHRRRLGSLRKGTRPDDSKRFIHLGKGQFPLLPFESRSGVFGRLRVQLLFERRIGSSALEKVTKRT